MRLYYEIITNYDNDFTYLVSFKKMMYYKEKQWRKLYMDVNIKKILTYCIIIALLFLIFSIMSKSCSYNVMPKGVLVSSVGEEYSENASDSSSLN